jgi:hypothetical protein
MSKHISGKMCESCQVKLKQAHPDLSQWYNSLIKPNFPDSHISWSYRGPDDQEKALESGNSHLPYPRSAHNKTDGSGNPCSTALDLFFLASDGVAIWPMSNFYQINSFCEKNNCKIFWGGKWAHLGDADHFQLSEDM